MRKIVHYLVILAFLVSYSACKNKPAKEPQKPVNKTVVQKEIKKDTSAIDSARLAQAKLEAAKKVEPPKPADRYFLIAGSFQDRAMAESYKSQLEKEGYDARVLERPNGPNNEFFKVSYKGFHDRKEAYRALRDARRSGEREGVWLMVQK
ncbi:MAG: SPOR domain-containing protein [Marinilabiliaceae bacterium]|nr:SPOR domain-containing protein [Marinilabiliaceae bacterium]